MLGRTLNQFAIEQKLGEGGMGVVYRARDTRLQRSVALKVLSADVTNDRERRKRFLQEGRAAARVVHPAIAQVYDVDEVDGVVFLAMELVEGKTVRQLIQAKELDLLGAIDIALSVGEGLAKAHEAGIVHRDIKPANVMVTPDGKAKILDFGLAKLLDTTHAADEPPEAAVDVSTMTQTQFGTVMGTAAYMSPEQVRGGAVDFRSDLFSLGVMLFEMVTWELPFRRGSLVDTLHAVAFDETPSVHSLRSNLPPDLQRILSRCLRKRPEDRYPTATELVRELQTLRRDTESGRVRALSVGERFADFVDRARHLQRKETLWLIGGAVALGVALYLVFSGANRANLWFYGLLGLFAYRFVRNRRRVQAGEFVRKVSRIPEVCLILLAEERITVVVDRPVAQLYGRINGLAEECNRSLFFGDPLSVVVRHDLAADEIRALLRGPNVHYVRDDVVKL